MKDYTEFPPYKYFLRVLKSYPKSALLYAQLWDKQDKKKQRVLASKCDIRKDYLISPTMFRNLIAPLAMMSLIHFEESDEKFRIDIWGTQAND